MTTPKIRAALDTFQQAANRGTAVHLSPELVQELRDALKAEPETPAEALAARPLSEHDLIEQWNAQADPSHQWESLDSSEQLAWAQARAIGADRSLHASSLIEKQDNIDALLTAFNHAYSAYGWVNPQQFVSLFDEAARLAGIVEEDWDASVYPYNTQAKAAAVLSDHHHNLVSQIATEGQIRGAVAYLVSKKHLDGDLLPAIQYAIARWGVSATTPVPTGDDSAWRSQLGWCNSSGECWWSPGPHGSWKLINPGMIYPAGWLLPHNAIPHPAPQAGEVQS